MSAGAGAEKTFCRFAKKVGQIVQQCCLLRAQHAQGAGRIDVLPMHLSRDIVSYTRFYNELFNVNIQG